MSDSFPLFLALEQPLGHTDFSQRMSAEGFTVHAVAKYSLLMDDVSSVSDSVVLLSPGFGGIDAIKTLRDLAEMAPNAVVVFVGEAVNSLQLVSYFRAGLFDFVHRASNIDAELLPRLIRAREKSEHRSSKKAHVEALDRELSEHLEVLQQDQAAGKVIQQKLAPPRHAEFGELSIQYEIHPSLFLTGDAIDYALINQRYFAFYLVDVSGHGSASAFVTVWVRQIVRSLLRERFLLRSKDSVEKDLQEVLSQANRELVTSGIGHHLTSLVGIIDKEKWDLTYVVAGHLPLPMLVSGAAHELLVLQGDGKPLGIFDDVQWRATTIELPSQFRLIAASDGLLETLPAVGLVGKEKFLYDEVRAGQPTSLEELKNILEIKGFDALPDDVAMLMIAGERDS
jgi:serine phosphatase RsbU (regulator of sigma subunit)